MARDIMGYGKEVNSCDAGPWLGVLFWHTGWAEWGATAKEIPPLDVAADEIKFWRSVSTGRYWLRLR